jgi:molecular chaperone GrpE (heat shock protein)
MSEQSRSKAAGYRKRAQEARDVARWMSLKDARAQLVESAENLERLAEHEERHQANPKPVARK